MKKIIWNDSFSVGVKTMDIQHKRIISTFNKLVDNVQAHPRSEKVSEVLAEMVDYACEHFESEERLLAEHKYPELSQQKAEHSAFRRQAGEFCILALSEDEQVTHKLLTYLHEWWTAHILYNDKRYTAHINMEKAKRTLTP